VAAGSEVAVFSSVGGGSRGGTAGSLKKMEKTTKDTRTQRRIFKFLVLFCVFVVFLPSLTTELELHWQTISSDAMSHNGLKCQLYVFGATRAFSHCCGYKWRPLAISLTTQAYSLSYTLVSGQPPFGK
jgi:hypothetical protein